MSDTDGYFNGRIPTPEAFGAVFSHFYFAENRLAQTITQTLLPSYQTILVFSFGTNVFLHLDENEGIEIAKCAVFGPVKRAFDYSLPPKSDILIANFKDDAFFSLAKLPLQRIYRLIRTLYSRKTVSAFFGISLMDFAILQRE